MTDIELHAHPIGLKKYGLENVFEIAKKNRLNAVALVGYNESIFPYVTSLAKDIKNYGIEQGKNVLKMSKENYDLYLLNAVEFMTSDNIHIITLESNGYKENDGIENIIKTDGLTIIDHPLVDATHPHRLAGDDTIKKLVRLCVNYKDKLAMEWNGYCIDWIWKNFLGGDVNEKTEIFAYQYGIPIVASTDLHGWNKDLMNSLGKSRIRIDSKDLDFNLDCLIPSIKKAIKERKYQNFKEYVSFSHFAKAFGIPVVASKLMSGIYPHARGKIEK